MKHSTESAEKTAENNFNCGLFLSRNLSLETRDKSAVNFLKIFCKLKYILGTRIPGYTTISRSAEEFHDIPGVSSWKEQLPRCTDQHLPEL